MAKLICSIQINTLEDLKKAIEEISGEAKLVKPNIDTNEINLYGKPIFINLHEDKLHDESTVFDVTFS